MREVEFYVGLHQPSDAHRFERTCISINRLRTRQKPVDCPEVLVDSGAFTELHQHGRYRFAPAEYAAQLRRLIGVVDIVGAVAQDFMCETFMLERTRAAGGSDGTIEDHQRLTIERYDALKDAARDLPFPIVPVLQGYAPADYARHARDYGDRLSDGMWVGVGSVFKRNGDPDRIVEVLHAIRRVRPGLRLHGFGVKRTALLHAGVRAQLSTADSLAWSYAARRQGRNANDWREAKAFAESVNNATSLAAEPWQMPLDLEGAA